MLDTVKYFMFIFIIVNQLKLLISKFEASISEYSVHGCRIQSHTVRRTFKNTLFKNYILSTEDVLSIAYKIYLLRNIIHRIYYTH